MAAGQCHCKTDSGIIVDGFLKLSRSGPCSHAGLLSLVRFTAGLAGANQLGAAGQLAFFALLVLPSCVVKTKGYLCWE
jgi:hypothetical protein